MKKRTAREAIARWLHSMDTATKWKDEDGETRGAYLGAADDYMTDPVHLKLRAEAWDEGYSRGNLDGYFGTHKEVNPYASSGRKCGSSRPEGEK